MLDDHEATRGTGFLLVTAAAATLWGMPGISVVATLTRARQPTPVSLEEGFANPPIGARPATYYLLLNGDVNRDHVDRELPGLSD